MSGGLRIREISPKVARERRPFVDLPFQLAAHHPNWQPGLRMIHDDLVHPARNPFWRGRRGSFFVAERGGSTVGRVAVVAPGQVPQKPDAAVLAFPDFVDDLEVTAGLFNAAAKRAVAQGANELVGPMNPDIHHDVGIQVFGHHRRNSAFMGYQPSYYAGHFDAFGFKPLAEFEAWSLHEETFVADGRMRRLADRVQRSHGVGIRPLNLKRFDEELRLFHGLYSRSFEGHWGFTAPTWDEFRFIASDLRFILRSRMALVAEWKGEAAGFVLGIPDFYSILPGGASGRLTPGLLGRLLWRWRKMDEARVMISGVVPEHRSRGLHLPLFYRVAKEIFDLGFKGGEIAWVMADNDPMAKALPLLGARRTKTYRMYGKELHQ